MTRRIVLGLVALLAVALVGYRAVAAGDNAEALVGQAAPSFTLADPSGQSVALESLRGKVVVLDFWATWCPPCRKGLPHLDKLAQQHAEDGVVVYAVNLKESSDKAKGFMDKEGLKLNVLMDSKGEVAKLYRVQGIPQTVVIDREGKVQAVVVGYSDGDTRVDEAVKSLLN